MWFCVVSKFGNRTHNRITHFGSTTGNTDTVAKPSDTISKVFIANEFSHFS